MVVLGWGAVSYVRVTPVWTGGAAVEQLARGSKNEIEADEVTAPRFRAKREQLKMC